MANPRLRPKAVRLLDALLSGQTVKLGDGEYGILAGVFGLWGTQSGKRVLLPVDLMLSDFIRIAEELDEAALVTLSARKVIAEIRAEQAKRRSG